MDEATSNIDIETERHIQKLIETEFKESTVITVAHRLNTIINSDRVLVLEFGKVREFEDPRILKADQTSAFYGFLKEFQQASRK